MDLILIIPGVISNVDVILSLRMRDIHLISVYLFIIQGYYFYFLVNSMIFYDISCLGYTLMAIINILDVNMCVNLILIGICKWVLKTGDISPVVSSIYPDTIS